MSSSLTPSSSSGLLAPGQLFAGRYRVERFLAQGAMGAVFVGEHVTTEKRVAIKVLWLQSAKSAAEQEKALLEARVSSRVRSENIVQILDAGFDRETGWLYLVMELLEGQTLEELVEARGRLPAAEVVDYLSQVAMGLTRAHAHVNREGTPQPIVHRDLKPDNLFVTRRDSGEALVKILDFGIAKVISKEASQGTNQPKGTPLYMAPEQLSLGGIGPGTDLWALGLIAFFLLTGKSFWLAAHAAESSLYALFAEIVTPPTATATERAAALGLAAPFPPAFDGWMARCLALSPADRFASASEAVQALSEALGEGPTRVSLPATLPAPPARASGPVSGSEPSALALSGVLAGQARATFDGHADLARTTASGSLGAPATRPVWLVLGASVGVLLVAMAALLVGKPLASRAHEPVGPPTADERVSLPPGSSSASALSALSASASSSASSASASATSVAPPVASVRGPEPPASGVVAGVASATPPTKPPPAVRPVAPGLVPSLVKRRAVGKFDPLTD